MEIKLNKTSYINKKGFSLQEINMEIKPGVINVIIGNGKTTLLEIILGIKTYTGGHMYYDKKLVSKKTNIWNKTAYIVENPESQFIFKTVLKEFERITTDYILIVEALKKVEMEEKILTRNPNSLSNSEKKKIAIALTILKNPDLIVIDEPSLSLDNNSQKILIKILKEFKKEGKTILLASSDVEFTHLVSDKIFVLTKTGIIFEGDKYKVFKEADILRSYGIDIPNVVKFSNVALQKKNVKLGYRDEINDLIKDIYRNVK